MACGSGATVTRDDAVGSRVHYHLELLDAADGWSVTARFPPRLSTRRMCIPAFGTREGERLEWQRVETERGVEAVAWDNSGCFDAPEFDSWLEVAYRARTGLSDAPAWRVSSLSPRRWTDRSMVLFPGEALFVELVDPVSRALPATVSVEIPDPWTLATTLDEATGERWRAKDADSLLSSALWASAGELRHDSSVGTRIWIDPDVSDISPSQVLVETRCLSGQLEHWRGRSVTEQPTPPEAALLVLDAPWGRDARDGFARRGGAVLQVGVDTANDTTEFRTLVAHELFHRINGQEIEYASDDFEATTWFREGATSYVALLSLAHAGLLSADGVTSVLAEHASAYLASPALADTSIGGDVRRRFEYDRGVMLALALDVTLRELSDGERTLAGFFAYLVHGTASGPLTSGELEGRLNRYADTDVSGFFTHYITSSSPLPVHALMRNIGFDVRPGSRRVADLGMWARYDDDDAAMKIAGVTRDGAAAAAGLAIGDEVRPVDGASWHEPAPQEWWVRSPDGSERTVTLTPSVRLLPALDLEDRGEARSAWRRVLDAPRSSLCDVLDDGR